MKLLSLIRPSSLEGISDIGRGCFWLVTLVRSIQKAKAMWIQTLLVGENQGAGEHLHLPDNISMAGHVDTVCCMYLTPAVASFCKEAAVMTLEMLNW